MGYLSRILLLTILILNINKKERIFYLPFDIPGSQMAATIPPFGIFIEDDYRNEGDRRGSILAHERVHWDQYKRMGLLKFYNSYFFEYTRHGRVNNWMESEARRLSK
jgi:hypothetical protein